jgi:hypothetical protein
VDNCSKPPVEFSEEKYEGSCEFQYTLVRTWSSADPTGHTVETYQTIEVQDTTPPVLSSHPPDYYNVDNSTFDFTPAVVTATDNSNKPIHVVYTQNPNSTVGLPLPFNITRQWVATDACGNINITQQLITVKYIPFELNVPPNATYPCDAVEDHSAVNDAVLQDVPVGGTVDFTELRVDGDCDFNYYLLRTWTVTDLSGVEKSATQSVQVTDTTNPVWDSSVSDYVHYFDEDCTPPGRTDPTASDNCVTQDGLSAVPGAVSVDYTNTSTAELIVHTWSVTDACGNVAPDQVQSVTLEDVTPPTLTDLSFVEASNWASEGHEACDILDPPPLTGEDNCEVDVTVTSSICSYEYTCAGSSAAYSATIKYTVIDSTGRSTEYPFTFSVTDSTPPTWISFPEDESAECVAPPVTQPTANDCVGVQDISYSDISDTNPQTHLTTIVREWTAVDMCGNELTDFQTILIQDDEHPTIEDPPGDEDYVCAADVPPATTLVGSDNCEDVTVDFTESQSGACPNQQRITRTWSAHDDSGNSAVWTQIVTVNDETAPILSYRPVDITVSCSVPAAPTVTATDNCDTPIEVQFAETGDMDCEHAGVVYRTWTAVDSCDNSVSHTQTITVTDATPYIIELPSDETSQCGPSTLTEAPLGVIDVCAGPNTFTDVAETTPLELGGGDCEVAVQYDWSYTSACGKSASHSATSVINDTTPPTLPNFQDDGVGYCDCLDPHCVPDVVGEDNCGGAVDVTMSEVSREESSAAGTVVVVTQIVATDDCGNTKTTTFTSYLQDTTPPSFDAPPGASYECDSVLEPEPPLGSDNCGDVTITSSKNTVDIGCVDSYKTVYTWIATDEAGLQTIDYTTITVMDSTDPTFDLPLPPEVDVQLCDAQTVPDKPTASDNCDEVPQVTMAAVPGSVGCSDFIIYTWTAEDTCGNTVETSQTVTVVDTAAPQLIGVPSDLTLECGVEPPNFSVQAEDNCDGPVLPVLTTDDRPGTCEDHYFRDFTWTAFDDCGNTISDTMTVEFVDIHAPVMHAPEDETYECLDAPDQPDLTGTDNCDSTIVPVKTMDVVSSGKDEIITWTWTAADDCGNISTETTTLTAYDTTPPTLPPLPPKSVTCTIPTPDPVQATELCGEVTVTMQQSLEEGSCAGEKTVTYTYTAIDEAGLTASTSQVITMYDTTAPTFEFSGTIEDVTAECQPDPAPQVLASDCLVSLGVITPTEVRINEGTSEEYLYQLVRTWTVTDDCSNTNSMTQTVTVQDTNPPVISGPDDETHEIPSSPEPASIADVTVSDVCSDVTTELSEVYEEGTCYDANTYIRTWTATDASGLTATHTQTIIIQDTTPPVFTGVPDDQTVQYTDVPTEAEIMGGIDATDHSGAELVFAHTVVSTQSAENPNEYTVTYTMTVTDACGNESSEVVIITVIDTEPCIFTKYPADDIVQCDEIPSQEDCVVLCEPDPHSEELLPVSFTEQTVTVSMNTYLLIRTWTNTDLAQNTASHSQTIEVQDTTPPFFSRQPGDVAVECDCDAFPGKPELTAMDNCDETLGATDIDFTENKLNVDNNAYTLVRTWSVTDASGNTVSHSQTVTVSDTSPPVFVQPPADATVTCSDPSVSQQQSLGAFDTCDDSVDVYHSELRLDPEGGCADSYILRREWTASDSNMNVATHTQVLTVVDDAAPTLQSQQHHCLVNNGMFAQYSPADLFDVGDTCGTVSLEFKKCNSTVAYPSTYTGDKEATSPSTTWNDSCRTSGDSLFVKGQAGDQFDRFFNVYAEAKDNCGNTATFMTTIQVPVSDGNVPPGVTCGTGIYLNTPAAY